MRAHLRVSLVVTAIVIAGVAAILSIGVAGRTVSAATAAERDNDLGQTSGLLLRKKLVLKSAIRFDLSSEINGGDDFLGSARGRLFGFVNGQTGGDNDEAQGFPDDAPTRNLAEPAPNSQFSPLSEQTLNVRLRGRETTRERLCPRPAGCMT